MFLADGSANCALHTQLPARAACARCGRFACDACITGDSRDEPYCIECDARMAADSVALVGRATQVTRIAGIAYAISSLILASLILMDEDQESLAFGLAALFQSMAVVTFAVSLVVWHRRTNRALRMRGMQLEFGPNAWGWYFAPYPQPLEAVPSGERALHPRHRRAGWQPLAASLVGLLDPR